MKHKTLGATFIVAGTAIGASMLALPEFTMKIGLTASVALVILLCIIGYSSACLMAKINNFYSSSYSISELCKKANLPFFSKIADLAIVSLFYSLLAAYISGLLSISEEQFSKVSSVDLINKNVGILMVGLLILLMSINIKITDIGNRVIFSLKILLFCVIIACFIPAMDMQNLLSNDNAQVNNTYFFQAIPVFFTSFGFHGSIPVIMRYLNKDLKKIKRSFFYASLIILMIYIFWILSSFAVTSQTNMDGDLHIKNLLNSSHILAMSTQLFSWLAIATSFLGVGISLYDYFREKLNTTPDSFLKKAVICFITFLPPIMINAFNKHIFIKALSFAAISLSVLAIILPAIVSLKISFANHDSKFSKINSVFFIILGICIIVADFIN